jgi:hypothetical protein
MLGKTRARNCENDGPLTIRRRIPLPWQMLSVRMSVCKESHRTSLIAAFTCSSPPRRRANVRVTGCWVAWERLIEAMERRTARTARSSVQ